MAGNVTQISPEKESDVIVVNGSDVDNRVQGTNDSSVSVLGTFYVTADSLNRRNSPEGSVIGKVTRGEAVEIAELRDGWARIAGATSGWVSEKYLSRTRVEPQSGNSTLQAGSDNVCQSGTSLDRQMTVTASALDVYVGPGNGFDRLVNEKASTAERTVYRQIYGPENVRELCQKDGWSFVEVGGAFPFSGWVSSESLTRIQMDDSGQRVYTAAEFPWDDERAIPFKETIVAGVNKIARENRQCTEISYASISVSKSNPDAPVFYASCVNAEGKTFNVFFNEDDVNGDNPNIAGEPINKQLAARVCKQHARSIATNPNTVDFSVQGYRNHDNGRTTVIGEFSAKNAYNLEDSYLINCLFDSKSMIDVSVTEKNG